jgi:hypothetical protein
LIKITVVHGGLPVGDNRRLKVDVSIGDYCRLSGDHRFQLSTIIGTLPGECEFDRRPSSGRIESWLRLRLPASYFHSVRKAKLRTQNNDEIVERLYRLNSLIWLQMDNSVFDNRKLVSLEKIRSLERLYLHNTSLNDLGLGHISHLQKLKYLRIGRTQITDDGMHHLRKLSSLETLYLNNNQLTDKELHHLTELKSLNCLHLENTRVTEAGLNQLKKSLPECLILGP